MFSRGIGSAIRCGAAEKNSHAKTGVNNPTDKRLVVNLEAPWHVGFFLDQLKTSSSWFFDFTRV